MRTYKKSFAILGGIIFFLGIILAFGLAGIMVWGDLEGSLFTTGIRSDSSLSSLNCPVIITENETSTISVVLKNPADKALERKMLANITEGYASLVREIHTDLTIPAGGKQKVEWKIKPEDAAFGQRVILFRVYVHPHASHPSLGANCGVVKLGVQGLTGKQIFVASTLLSLSFLAIGAVLIQKSHLPVRSRVCSTANCLYTLAGILIVAGIMSYFGLWALGLVALVVAVLLGGVFIARQITGIR
ncbi:MAG TPA: hypothetical protein DEH22_11610 [Chloroflexi bacterium]|nr:hypothetical protein [Chloroflexota bacterium]